MHTRENWSRYRLSGVCRWHVQTRARARAMHCLRGPHHCVSRRIQGAHRLHVSTGRARRPRHHQLSVDKCGVPPRRHCPLQHPLQLSALRVSASGEPAAAAPAHLPRPRCCSARRASHSHLRGDHPAALQLQLRLRPRPIWPARSGSRGSAGSFGCLRRGVPDHDPRRVQSSLRRLLSCVARRVHSKRSRAHGPHIRHASRGSGVGDGWFHISLRAVFAMPCRPRLSGLSHMSRMHIVIEKEPEVILILSRTEVLSLQL